MSKSRKQLKDEIKKLLMKSYWSGNGPHGTTINAVMRRVERLTHFMTIKKV